MMEDSQQNQCPALGKRTQNFSEQECALILEFVEANKSVLNSKFNNVVTNDRKNKIWAELTDKVNSLGVGKRTEGQIRRKWKNMVCTSKKEMGTYKAVQRKTGGGAPPKEPSSITQKIWDLNKESPAFSGLIGVDSEAMAACGNGRYNTGLD